MSISDISAKLTAAGCTVAEWKGIRVYVKATPNGGRGDYGYCVAGDDDRDITRNITRRAGEIATILRA